MDELTIEGKVYISSKRAAEISAYSKDYVGQLCREGKVEARIVGRAWYIDETSLMTHKKENSEVKAGSTRSKDEDSGEQSQSKSPQHASPRGEDTKEEGSHDKSSFKMSSHNTLHAEKSYYRRSAQETSTYVPAQRASEKLEYKPHGSHSPYQKLLEEAYPALKYEVDMGSADLYPIVQPKKSKDFSHSESLSALPQSNENRLPILKSVYIADAREAVIEGTPISNHTSLLGPTILSIITLLIIIGVALAPIIIESRITYEEGSTIQQSFQFNPSRLAEIVGI